MKLYYSYIWMKEGENISFFWCVRCDTTQNAHEFSRIIIGNDPTLDTCQTLATLA